ncbi:MAG TPA: hypothetical protein VJZ27_00735, partial [Aggregatilineales bacterium]|nr:hypothetical protein [Aggregatilineales bacterium]
FILPDGLPGKITDSHGTKDCPLSSNLPRIISAKFFTCIIRKDEKAGLALSRHKKALNWSTDGDIGTQLADEALKSGKSS